MVSKEEAFKRSYKEFAKYDTSNNGYIEKKELRNATYDYYDEKIEYDKVLDLYLAWKNRWGLYPVLDSVSVEKIEVCEGEQAVAKVRIKNKGPKGNVQVIFGRWKPGEEVVTVASYKLALEKEVTEKNTYFTPKRGWYYKVFVHSLINYTNARVSKYKSKSKQKLYWLDKTIDITILTPKLELVSTSYPTDAFPSSNVDISSKTRVINCPSTAYFGYFVDNKRRQKQKNFKAGESATFSGTEKITKEDLNLRFFAFLPKYKISKLKRGTVNALAKPKLSVNIPKYCPPNKQYTERVKVTNEGGEGDVRITREGEEYTTASFVIDESKTFSKKFKMPLKKATNVGKYEGIAIGVNGDTYPYSSAGPFKIEAVRALFSDTSKSIWIRAPENEKLSYKGTIAASGLEGVKPAFSGTLSPKEVLQIKFDKLIATYIKFDKKIVMIENGELLGDRSEYKYNAVLGFGRAMAPTMRGVPIVPMP